MREQAVVEPAVADALVAGTTPVSSLPDDELLAVVDELAARRRRIDAALAAAAGEVRARSEGLPAEDSLVRRAGHTTEASMLQHRVGLRSREARMLCSVAEATRAKVSLTGADVPVSFPHVAAALAAGWISVSQAHAIVETLSGSNGRVSILQTALDAHVKPSRVRLQDACGAKDEEPVEADAADEHDGVDVDDRTREQRRIDALVTIVGRHAETTSPRIAGEAPVLTITVSEDALHGRGSTLADIPRLHRSGDTVPVSVAARILCDGFVQSIVHGSDGEPLKQGRRHRLFTTSQRRAIIAHDRRCRAPGCTAPPGWCETHHVRRWADDGPTDVGNGASC